ncbi:pupal cuticle protein 20-like [Ischnura elegans]|uniref:pupal cuticle protein 20-like n=1 Tax=Ischnura elegans TaxID=197161 RepID=UPI001ED87FED|nr:pupal cuticle protein 20-like [Ischnura elegans]
MNSMTVVVFLAVAIAAVSALPQFTTGTRFTPTRPFIPIVQMDDVRDDAGQFSLRYITGDGTTVTEVGKLVPTADGKGYVLVKEGSYQYKTPEGRTINLKYLADENGFQPIGDHLPVAPVA